MQINIAFEMRYLYKQEIQAPSKKQADGSLKLHRALAALLPVPRRRKLRLRYSRKARLYRLLALLPGRKSADRRPRADVNATLADCS